MAGGGRLTSRFRSHQFARRCSRRRFRQSGRSHPRRRPRVPRSPPSGSDATARSSASLSQKPVDGGDARRAFSLLARGRERAGCALAHSGLRLGGVHPFGMRAVRLARWICACESGRVTGEHGLSQQLESFREVRRNLEASVLPLATSVDGRRFSFEASLHGVQVAGRRLGGELALPADAANTRAARSRSGLDRPRGGGQRVDARSARPARRTPGIRRADRRGVRGAEGAHSPWLTAPLFV